MALGLGWVIGLALAFELRLGIGLLAVVGFGVLVLLDLPLGIGVWIGLIFIERLPIVWVLPLMGLVMIAIAWFGHLRHSRSETHVALAEQRAVLLPMAALLVWMAVSVVWSREPDRSLDDLWTWGLAAVTLLTVSTALRTERDVTLIAVAFVLGAMLSVTVGFLDIDVLQPTAADPATELEGRLGGGRVNPNDLAIALVPALALAAALLGGFQGRWWRPVVAPGIVLLAVGLAATGSRGGLIAAITASAAAVVVAGSRRIYVVTSLLFVMSGAALWFMMSPAAWERVTSLEGGGAGRVDTWQVAWRVYEDHPLFGVGLNQFEVLSPEYVRAPGNLDAVELIVEQEIEAHNIYAELLVELGPLALALFVMILGASLRCAWVAGRRFDALGERALGGIARAVTVSLIAVATALFFSSNAQDLELWVLVALAPALLGLTRRRCWEPTP